MYKVIKHFTDNQDKGYAYNVGDEFPRKGLNVSDKRLAELSSNENKQGVPLIESVVVKSTATPAQSKVKKAVQEAPLTETPEEVSPVPEKTLENTQTGESPIEAPKAEEKPRRGKKKANVKSDS